jgi:hypothetical protein
MSILVRGVVRDLSDIVDVVEEVFDLASGFSR